MPAPAHVLSIDELRRLARRRLPKMVFEFIDGGAEDETTLRRNRADFEELTLLPRVLADVSAADPACRFGGATAAAPLVVAPMGSCALAWPGADVAIAQAAAAAGIPYTLSTMATTSIERLADTVGGRLWFQLYTLKDRDFTARLVDRANAAGYEALVVTVDLATGGKRERDLRNGIAMPLRIGPRQALDAALHPRWALRLWQAGRPRFENIADLRDDGAAGLTIAARVGEMLDAGFDWDALARIRERWPRRLVVKGVQHPADARRLADAGIDAVWVSNHGGRQLDGARSAIGSLPAVRAAVDGRCEVYLDSGVRRGVDLLKAVALGADAVAAGRAVLFGAAVAGREGAARAIAILVDELRRAMRLAGVASLPAARDAQLFDAPASCARPSAAPSASPAR